LFFEIETSFSVAKNKFCDKKSQSRRNLSKKSQPTLQNCRDFQWIFGWFQFAKVVVSESMITASF